MVEADEPERAVVLGEPERVETYEEGALVHCPGLQIS